MSACIFYLVALSGYFFFFFFQAEDGIRDYKVTGVQTCALPISRVRLLRGLRARYTSSATCLRHKSSAGASAPATVTRTGPSTRQKTVGMAPPSIGHAAAAGKRRYILLRSCRHPTSTPYSAQRAP